VARTFPTEVAPSEASQLGVDERNEAFEGSAIAVTPGLE